MLTFQIDTSYISRFLENEVFPLKRYMFTDRYISNFYSKQDACTAFTPPVDEKKCVLRRLRLKQGQMQELLGLMVGAGRGGWGSLGFANMEFKSST